jgi:hypothetical protein
MVDGILIYWLLIFIVLLIVNLAGDSTTFGIIDGFWLLILGLAVIVTGVQLQSGMNVTTVGTSQIISYTYSDVVLPFSTYSIIWGIFFIGLAMYMIIANGMRRAG